MDTAGSFAGVGLVMGSATGLGLLDVAILEACEASGATIGRVVSCEAVLEELHRRTGIGPRVAYEPLCDLARPWVLQLCLLDFVGNFGSPEDPPADPQYTECSLSRLGEAALAAERGDIGSLPIGLINGTTHVGGVRPPLDPKKVVAAIRAVVDPGVSDDDVVRLVSLPSFPTGCEVYADEALVASGNQVYLVVSARLDHDDGFVTISHLPPGSSAVGVEEAIADLVNGPGRSAGSSRAEEEPLPLRSIRNETSKGRTRIVVDLRPHADSAAVIARIEQLQLVRKTMQVRFERPLIEHLREAAADRDGLDERLAITVPSA